MASTVGLKRRAASSIFHCRSSLNGTAEYDFIYALHETADGRVWAGTAVGLVVLDPVRNTASRVDLATVPDGELTPVTAIYADRKGRLWIATIEHGVLILDPATGRSMRPHAGAIGETGSLPDTEYISIAGTDNTIFVGSWGEGIYSAPLEEPQFWLLTPAANGIENVTAVLGGASAGKPWVGTFGGGTQRVDVLTGSSAPTGRDPADLLSGAGILSIAASTDGSYFAGSTEGLFRFAADGSSLAHDSYAADRKDGIGEGYVIALLPDATGLWVGTGGSGLYQRDLHGTQYRAFRHDPSVANSLSGDFITALAPGRAGRLWVGTRYNGLNLCIIEPWSCERFDGRTPGERNLANYHVTALHRDSDGAAMGGDRRRWSAPRERR